MSEKTNNRLYLMITITNRVKGATHFIDFYRAFGAPVVFTALEDVAAAPAEAPIRA